MISRDSRTARSSSHNGYVATRPAVIALSKVLFLGLSQTATVAAAPITSYLGITSHHEHPDPDDASLWLYLLVAAVLVLLGGAFAGLTIA